MNTFKINYTITGSCSLFPHSHSVCSVTGCRQRTHRSTVSAVPLQARSVARSAPSHVSISPAPVVNRRHSLPRRAPVCYRVFRHSMRRDSRNDVNGLSTDPPAPSRLLRPPFCRPRVLALGYGALRPSYRSEPRIVFRSAKIVTPDTLVASITANGGYRLFAAHFAAGHGASLRSTLRVYWRMGIWMAVSHSLQLLCASRA